MKCEVKFLNVDDSVNVVRSLGTLTVVSVKIIFPWVTFVQFGTL